LHGPGSDADQDQQARRHSGNKHGGSRNYSSVMMAATATTPAGGECGKPGSPRTTATSIPAGSDCGKPGSPRSTATAILWRRAWRLAGNSSLVMMAVTATTPAGGECGKPGSHAYYGPAMTLSISWAAQYNDGPADMAVS